MISASQKPEATRNKGSRGAPPLHTRMHACTCTHTHSPEGTWREGISAPSRKHFQIRDCNGPPGDPMWWVDSCEVPQSTDTFISFPSILMVTQLTVSKGNPGALSLGWRLTHIKLPDPPLQSQSDHSPALGARALSPTLFWDYVIYCTQLWQLLTT